VLLALRKVSLLNGNGGAGAHAAMPWLTEWSYDGGERKCVKRGKILPQISSATKCAFEASKTERKKSL
jgi:hypothetical protein